MKVVLNFDNKKYFNNPSSSVKHLKESSGFPVASRNRDLDLKYVDKMSPSSISFAGNIFEGIDDNSFFNDNDANLFSIKFFNQLHDDLFKYKTPIEPELSKYLTDNQTTDKLESGTHITLVNNASAKSLKSMFIDLNGMSKTKHAEAAKNLYMFDNSTCGSAKADRIFLSDNAYSSKNIAGKIWIKDGASADKIQAQDVYQRNTSSVGETAAKNLYMRDNSYSKDIHAENIILKDNAYIEKAESSNGQVELKDNAHINTLVVDNSKIFLGKNACIDKIISEGNPDITGNGTIGEIELKGSHAFIRGNIKLNGNIRFLNENGVVVVQKGVQNIFPKIESSMVENGLLQFLIQNSSDAYLGNPVDTFSTGIRLLNDNVQNRSVQKSPVISSLISCTTEAPGIENRNLYIEFFNSYLKTLSTGEDNKLFSLFWVKNAKLGDKKLADLWISMLGKIPDKIADTQKTYMLNNLSEKEKIHLIKATSEYWINNILPAEKRKIHFDDINTIENDGIYIENLLKVIQSSPDKFAELLENKDFFDRLCSVDFGNEKLISFWLKDTRLPESSLHTDRLKKEYLKNLIKDADFVQKLVNKTEIIIDKQIKSLAKFRLACSDIITNEPDVDKLQKNLLNKYKDSRILYNIVAFRTGYSDNITEMESEILRVLTLLAQERNSLAITARKDIFDKTLNVPNVVTAKPNTQLNNYTAFVFNTLAQSTASLDTEGLNDLSDRIFAFNNYVNKKSYYLGNLWQEFVKDAYIYYKDVILDKITDNNLNLLYSIEMNNYSQAENKMTKFLEGDILNSIEQKEFVSRYQNDYNFQVLMNNDGINQKNVLSNLLKTEAVNENMYRLRLDNFSKAINNNTVKENLDIVDKYLRIQDKDYPVMTISEKVNAISNIPQEEFLYMNNLILQEWKNNELRNFMSDKFNQIQLANSINAQSSAIVNSLEKINNNLDNIRVNVAGQYLTINEMAGNIDRLVNIQRKTFKELYLIGEQIEAINHDTQSIRDNTRAILYSAMQNAKMRDPELSKTIKDLLPETERGSFTDFLSSVEKKYKALNDEKRKKQLNMLAQLATMAVVATGLGGLSPDVVAGFIGGGDIALKVSNGILSVMDTLKHVAIFKIATTGMKQN